MTDTLAIAAVRVGLGRKAVMLAILRDVSRFDVQSWAGRCSQSLGWQIIP
jgi:hypothetical protein